MNKKEVLNRLWFCILFTSFSILQCSQGTYIQGQQFPEMVFPDGIGTILFFYMENLEMYQSQSAFFDDAEKTELLINRLIVDLKLIKEQYPLLQIQYVDISQKSQSVVTYQIFRIPTIVLLDNLGYEVRRWVSQDFIRGGGAKWEIKKNIDKLKIPRK